MKPLALILFTTILLDPGSGYAMEEDAFSFSIRKQLNSKRYLKKSKAKKKSRKKSGWQGNEYGQRKLRKQKPFKANRRSPYQDQIEEALRDHRPRVRYRSAPLLRYFIPYTPAETTNQQEKTRLISLGLEPWAAAAALLNKDLPALFLSGLKDINGNSIANGKDLRQKMCYYNEALGKEVIDYIKSEGFKRAIVGKTFEEAFDLIKEKAGIAESEAK